VAHAHERGIASPLVRFRPLATSALARAVGLPLGGADHPTLALPVDALDVAAGEQFVRRLAVNGVVTGVAPARLRGRHPFVDVAVVADGRPVGPGRATTVAVMGGQFLGDADLVPRGHPGDGRAEVVVITVEPKDRKAMRERLPRGDHVPHPGITIVSARSVRLEWAAEQPCEIDGFVVGRRRVVEVAVVPHAFRLLV
jgi:diacylglycerol kinase family enzyme